MASPEPWSVHSIRSDIEGSVTHLRVILGMITYNKGDEMFTIKVMPFVNLHNYDAKNLCTEMKEKKTFISLVFICFKSYKDALSFMWQLGCWAIVFFLADGFRESCE